MEIVGLEPRRNDLARGIVIARSTRPLTAEEQRALWDALSVAGITELGEDGHDLDDGTERQWLAAPWIPPLMDQVDAQRTALQAAAVRYDLETIWLLKVETGIDGLMWIELTRSEPGQDDDDDATAEAEATDAPSEVSALLDDGAEVLYAAPDVSGAIAAAIVPGNLELPGDAPEADDDDADDDDEDDDSDMESHWRAGSPPFENSVGFPIEGYPEILGEYDWESFGIAIKLGGEALPGEESVINAFFALWLSAYQDERAEGFEAFQRADVVHDRVHRSALMWVERFAVPATASEQVHFLLWIVSRIHAILPIAWARFDNVDDAVKSRAMVDDDGDPFVLAGNPFADRFERQGEEAALAWAVSQSAWSRRELAGMLVEVALDHDPDDAATATIAERLLRRALAFDPGCDATGYLAIVMIRQQRLADAIALAGSAPSRDVRMLVVGEAAEHAPGQLDAALTLLDPATLAETPREELAELTASIARHAPSYLGAILGRLPEDPDLVTHLYNASFTIERPQALAMLRRVLELPIPSKDHPEQRTAYVMAWNNACIHAHALGDYELAVQLADGGQPYGVENPYIHHSAACAYTAVGQIDRAIAQVALSIEREYEHAEKMETDADLAPLQKDPRFTALFVEWREHRADLN